jgi:hypothetical protein
MTRPIGLIFAYNKTIELYLYTDKPSELYGGLFEQEPEKAS